jgi:hypothetical protein
MRIRNPAFKKILIESPIIATLEISTLLFSAQRELFMFCGDKIIRNLTSACTLIIHTNRDGEKSLALLRPSNRVSTLQYRTKRLMPKYDKCWLSSFEQERILILWTLGLCAYVHKYNCS